MDAYQVVKEIRTLHDAEAMILLEKYVLEEINKRVDLSTIHETMREVIATYIKDKDLKIEERSWESLFIEDAAFREEVDSLLTVVLDQLRGLLFK